MEPLLPPCCPRAEMADMDHIVMAQSDGGHVTAGTRSWCSGTRALSAEKIRCLIGRMAAQDIPPSKLAQLTMCMPFALGASHHPLPPMQVRISRWFGELESTFYKHPHSPHPDVFRVSNDRQHGCTGLPPLSPPVTDVHTNVSGGCGSDLVICAALQVLGALAGMSTAHSCQSHSHTQCTTSGGVLAVCMVACA
jgi:hypothetical protein